MIPHILFDNDNDDAKCYVSNLSRRVSEIFAFEWETSLSGPKERSHATFY